MKTSTELTILIKNEFSIVQSTIVDKNKGTNDKFYQKVAILMYTEMFNFRPQS